MGQGCRIPFPVLAIKDIHRNRVNSAAIKAAQIDAKSIWVRAWRIKGLYTAVFAERVLGSAGIKGISADRTLTA